MADVNRYAPPRAVVDDAMREHGEAPPLWNPNATANWSLVFTPVFGAWLQMRNWRALGETRRSDSAKIWLKLSATFLALEMFVLFLPTNTPALVMKLFDVVWLLAWYFASGRPHVKWVRERFGSDYPRRPWLPPLLWAFGTYAAFYVLELLVDAAIGQRD